MQMEISIGDEEYDFAMFDSREAVRKYLSENIPKVARHLEFPGHGASERRKQDVYKYELERSK